MKIDTRATSVYPNFFKDYDDVKEVAHPSGKGLVAYMRNNKYLSMSPDGAWVEDKDSAGPWEAFYPYGNMAVHPSSGSVIPRFAGEVPNV